MSRILAVMIVLGLAAIDPIGIAAMPLLLAQEHPLSRSVTFLGGSFVSLVSMGLLFSLGAGRSVLSLEYRWHWLVPFVELTAAIVLLGIAGYVLRELLSQHTVEAVPARVSRMLRMGAVQVFGVGALLVAIQSIVDVVFVIAMIRLGQVHLSFIGIIGAVSTYALAALALQSMLVGVYLIAPKRHKVAAVRACRALLSTYISQMICGISFVLACIFAVLALVGFRS